MCRSRRGSVLPTLGVCLIALFGFVALAVDLGMLAVSRTQCQNAADVAALVGAVGTADPPTASIPPEQIITGSYDVRISKMKSALERIAQSGVQVTLVE